MVLLTMIARVADGLPLAASMQEDEQVGPRAGGGGWRRRGVRPSVSVGGGPAGPSHPLLTNSLHTSPLPTNSLLTGQAAPTQALPARWWRVWSQLCAAPPLRPEPRPLGAPCLPGPPESPCLAAGGVCPAAAAPNSLSSLLSQAAICSSTRAKRSSCSAS